MKLKPSAVIALLMVAVPARADYCEDLRVSIDEADAAFVVWGDSLARLSQGVDDSDATARSEAALERFQTTLDAARDAGVIALQNAGISVDRGESDLRLLLAAQAAEEAAGEAYLAAIGKESRAADFSAWRAAVATTHETIYAAACR